MTIKQYNICVSKTSNYADRDSYVSDMSLSSLWGDAPEDGIPQDRIAALTSIWDVCHISVKDIAKAAGMSARAMAMRLCIPSRTVEDWCRGISKCPVYVRLMMQQSLGLYDPPVD